MTGKVVSLLTGAIALSFALSGCLFNTPDRAIKRFIGHLKDMQWDSMAELVDWPQTAQYMPGFPEANEGEEDRKKEIMMQIAENWTRFPVRQKTAYQIRHEFLYLRISRLKRMRDSKNWAWMDVKITLDARAKEVKILVMKINRLWRVVLTDSVFQ